MPTKERKYLDHSNIFKKNSKSDSFSKIEAIKITIKKFPQCFSRHKFVQFLKIAFLGHLGSCSSGSSSSICFLISAEIYVCYSLNFLRENLPNSEQVSIATQPSAIFPALFRTKPSLHLQPGLPHRSEKHKGFG